MRIIIQGGIILDNKHWLGLILFSFMILVLSGCTANIDSGMEDDLDVILDSNVFSLEGRIVDVSEGFGEVFVTVEFDDGYVSTFNFDESYKAQLLSYVGKNVTISIEE